MHTARKFILVVSAVMLLTACSARPSQEMAAARNAVDELISEGAELFAPEELREINDKLAYALALIKTEDYDLVKNYRLPRHILQQIRKEAEILQVKVIWRKKELHEAALAALDDAREAVSELGLTLKGMLSEPLLPANANRLRYDADQLISALDDIQRQITGGEFDAAAANARSLFAQATTLCQAIRQSRSVPN